MAEASAGANGPGAAGPAPAEFNSADIHRVDILALAENPAGGDEANFRKSARTNAQGHIGDRVTKSVQEGGRRRAPRPARIFKPRLGAGEPFRIEIGIGGRRITSGAERPE